jgi:hypothetical protein
VNYDRGVKCLVYRLKNNDVFTQFESTKVPKQARLIGM